MKKTTLFLLLAISFGIQAQNLNGTYKTSNGCSLVISNSSSTEFTFKFSCQKPNTGYDEFGLEGKATLNSGKWIGVERGDCQIEFSVNGNKINFVLNAGCAELIGFESAGFFGDKFEASKSESIQELATRLIKADTVVLDYASQTYKYLKNGQPINGKIQFLPWQTATKSFEPMIYSGTFKDGKCIDTLFTTSDETQKFWEYWNKNEASVPLSYYNKTVYGKDTRVTTAKFVNGCIVYLEAKKNEVLILRMEGKDGWLTKKESWWENGKKESEEYFVPNPKKTAVICGKVKNWGMGIILPELTEGLENGVCKKWEKDGNPKSVITYKDGKRHGAYSQYCHGLKAVECTYVDGKMDGLYKSWYCADGNQGKKQAQGMYKNGTQVGGTWTYWNKEGVVTKKE